jgi:hypothetical protein
METISDVQQPKMRALRRWRYAWSSRAMIIPSVTRQLKIFQGINSVWVHIKTSTNNVFKWLDMFTRVLLCSELALWTSNSACLSSTKKTSSLSFHESVTCSRHNTENSTHLALHNNRWFTQARIYNCIYIFVHC